MEERLQKILAAAGFGSRRQCEKIIQEGRVRLNGQPVTEMGVRADDRKDTIEVDGKPIKAKPLMYVLLYKPRGYASTRKDPHAKKTILDLIPEHLHHLYPVGRLDVPSEGLMLLTNDGDLAQFLTHPRFEVPKVYRVSVSSLLDNQKLEALRNGVELEDGLTKPALVSVLQRDAKEAKTRLEMVLFEGRKRQIRRMFEALELEVSRLKRVAIGPIEIGDLRPGQNRKLTDDEIKKLKEYRIKHRRKLAGSGGGTRR